MCTLYINWTLNTHALIRTQTRAGYGCELKLGVFACGTAVAAVLDDDFWRSVTVPPVSRLDSAAADDAPSAGLPIAVIHSSASEQLPV